MVIKISQSIHFSSPSPLNKLQQSQVENEPNVPHTQPIVHEGPIVYNKKLIHKLMAMAHSEFQQISLQPRSTSHNL